MIIVFVTFIILFMKIQVIFQISATKIWQLLMTRYDDYVIEIFRYSPDDFVIFYVERQRRAI